MSRSRTSTRSPACPSIATAVCWSTRRARPEGSADADREHDVGAPLVVEWRALTVALLDALAPLVRTRLGVSAAAFPLAKVLEGGTWAAGRKLARERRADGGPPIKVVSDGTVF